MGFLNKKNKDTSKDKDDSDLASLLSDESGEDSAIEIGEMLDDDEIGRETVMHDLNYDEYGDLDEDESGYVPGIASEKKVSDKEQEEFERKSKILKIAGGVIAVIMIALIAFVALNGGTSNENNTNQQSQSQEDNKDTNSQGGEGVTVNEQINKPYVGNQNGNAKSSGTGAILAFDYAYYTKRSGKEAIKYFNPDVKAYNAATIQTGIDKVSQGTEYELSITPKVIGEKYEVKLKLSVPGYDPIIYNQNFDVMKKDGQFYVKSFNLVSSSLDDGSQNGSPTSTPIN